MMGKRNPHNPIGELIKACSGETKEIVVLWKEPKVDPEYFRIFGGDEEVKSQIANGFLELLEYVPPPRKLKLWEDQKTAPLVDGYTFKSGGKEGYIAYFKAPTGNWVIKSLHKDKNAIAVKMEIDITKLKLSDGG